MSSVPMVGRSLGPFRVLEKIGEGGMGEVYRASDPRLGRDVALKVVPEAFAQDSQRMTRFSREAQVLASLNHANIAHLYGLEEADGTRALVMELVEGPTLGDRLTQGPLALDEALPIALQITEALEYAHERGIIHRDLKPANVKITPEAKVKLLDFGLAKALEDTPAAGNISTSPTLSHVATAAGIVLGTAAYMSPEQARGKSVDRRTDIWSFGCVLYEMLAGKRAFDGETISDTLASVLRAEPDWNSLPAETPARIRELLRRCLNKDPKQRLRDIGEARITIENLRKGTMEDGSVLAALPVQQRPAWRRALPSAAALLFALLAIAALAAYWRAAQTAPAQLMRLALTLPEPVAPTAGAFGGSPVAISADGRQIVYVASGPDKPPQLYLRALDQPTATVIEGTEGANQPFFSPDGQSIGFTARGKLLRVSARGGPVTTICDAAQVRGAAWSSDDIIVFSPNATAGLARVSSSGGTPQMLTVPDPKSDISHRWPDVLPGGKSVLFTIGSSTATSFDDARIALLSLETGKWRTLIEGGSYARYVPAGYIVYGRAGTLMAVPFDLKHLEVTGPPVPVLEGVVTVQRGGAAGFALSSSGMLVYVAGSSVLRADRALVWVDRQGVAKELPAPPRGYFAPSISPDGRRLAVQLGSTIEQSDIWVYEFARNTLTRLTFGPAGGAYPLWTPDGKHIAFQSLLGLTFSLRWKPADNSGAEEDLFVSASHDTAARNVVPHSFSPGAKVLLFSARGATGATGIQTLSLEADHKYQPLMQSQFEQTCAQFSPDGRWVAYQSDETGRAEVYVQPYPGPGGKWQISVEGGTSPRWSHDGREIFFRNGDKMMSVAVETQPAFKAGTPRVLFTGNYLGGGGPDYNYDVTLDGQHFIMIKEKETGGGPKELNVILNWFEELRRRVPPANK